MTTTTKLGAVWGVVILAVAVLVTPGCVTPDWLTKPATQDTPIMPPVLAPTEPTIAEWPAYRGDKWTTHGNTNEDQVRLDIIAAAKAQGADVIRFVHLGTPPANDAAAWLFKFRGERKDFPLTTDGWYYRARRAGVTRWIAEVSAAHLTRWRYIFKDYAATELQIVVNGKVLP